MIDGVLVVLKEQFQMYAPNLQLQIPLVSGILAASLGGMFFLLRSPILPEKESPTQSQG